MYGIIRHISTDFRGYLLVVLYSASEFTNCGKAGQWVPVGVGQPSLLIGGLTVGGSAV